MGILHKIRKAARSFPDPMFRRALRLGVAPSHEHRAMLSSLGDVRTVVDVGANVGQFALLTLRLLPNAHVDSFEPLPDAADKFQKVIDGNAKVTLHRMALGAQEAMMPIHVTSRADNSSLLAPALQSVFYPGTHEVRTHDVQVVPLDHVL
jgi:FkbM family methyltransferase